MPGDGYTPLLSATELRDTGACSRMPICSSSSSTLLCNVLGTLLHPIGARACCRDGEMGNSFPRNTIPTRLRIART